MTLMATLKQLVILLKADFQHPSWRPIWNEDKPDFELEQIVSCMATIENKMRKAHFFWFEVFV